LRRKLLAQLGALAGQEPARKAAFALHFVHQDAGVGDQLRQSADALHRRDRCQLFRQQKAGESQQTKRR
jgi:hypothetical protein